jgi:hypothetical protein
MNTTIRFNETTYDFKYRLGIDSNNDSYEVFDIYIDGKKSIYHLEEIFTGVSVIKKEYCLFWNGFGSGTYISNPTSILDLSKVIDEIQFSNNGGITENETK